MNIFILDKNIRKCARYHCDQHVVKMLLESAQILCTVCNQHGINSPYRSTHIHHPCVKWAGASQQNWRWLRKLAFALNEEFKYRYRKHKNHRSFTVIKKLREPNLPNVGLTEFVLAMPEKYKVSKDPVLSYRNYYIGQKKVFAKWTRRQVPKWLT